MAQTIKNLYHEWRPNVELVAIKPEYADRMYISGFLGFISTTYKREMVAHQGVKEVWTCSVCGNSFEDELHKPKFIRTDRID